MIAVMSFFKLFFSGVISFFQGLPPTVKTGLLLILVLVGSNVGTHYYTKHAVTAKHEAQVKEMLKTWGAQQAAARFAQAQAEDTLLVEIQAKLEASRAEKQRVITIIKEKEKYVTPKADSMCVITAGFVWLHDLPITGAGAGATLPASRPGDVDAPTGIKISQVAGVVGENNAECAERGRIINLWQDWYIKEKEIYSRALGTVLQAEQQAISTVSGEPK